MDSLRLAVQGKKVKKLTDRRVKIISAFLIKTLKFPQNYDPFASLGWIRMLLKFLCEAKHCKITCLDVKAWLTADCFKQLIHQIHQQEKKINPTPIKSDCELISTFSLSSSSSVSSEQPWSNVLEALNLIPRQSQESKCSSSSQDFESMSYDISSEEPMKTSAAQALLMLHNEKYHDKRSQLSMISSST